jgi:hypothetical protein
MGTYPKVRDTGEKLSTIPHRVSVVEAGSKVSFVMRGALWDGPVAD